MTLNDLITFLNKIKKVHPEAGEAQVWASSDYQVNSVGFDKKHKPARIKLED